MICPRSVLLGVAPLLVQVGCGDSPPKVDFSQLWLPRAESPTRRTPSSKPDVNVFAAQRDERPAPVPTGPPRILLETQFDLMRISVPFGAISQSREIWNLIDEQVLPVSLIEHLRRNGTRVGLASEANWPSLKITLDEIPDTKITRQQVILKNAFPLELALDREPRLNTIFFYRLDDSLPGASYPQSKRYLHCAHTLDPQDFDKVILSITPEIRQEKKGMKWEMTELGLRRAPVYQGKVFAELSTIVPVPAGSVLVIGPGPAAAEPSLIGGAFFTEQEEGNRRETVYFIAPRVVRTTTAQR